MPKKQAIEPTTVIRSPCYDCVRKHLMQAAILMLEYRKSDPAQYPLHPWWAVGHLGEAEDELSCAEQELAKAIRMHRLKYQENRGYQIPIEQLVELVTEAASKE
jgi:hypothetical protein